jgi:diamine N-acetyltransferase
MGGATMNDVLLRAIEPQDIDVIYKWENDEEIWESSETHKPFSRYMLEQYIISEQNSDILSLKQQRLMIDIEIDGNVMSVGCVDIFDYNVFHRRAGIGILVDKKYRGRGVATAAIDKVSDYCKRYLHLHSLYANIAVDNISSIRAFEKNGFLLIGTKNDWLYDGEAFHDEYMFQKILK